MSSLTMPPAVTPTLPAMNLPPHGHGGHGHKKGSPLDLASTSSSTSTAAAPTAVGTAQNLLGSLFSSLQQVIGGTPLAAATNLVASATNAVPGSPASGSAAVGSAAAAAPKINVMA
jgi:hypothetical protein